MVADLGDTCFQEEGTVTRLSALLVRSAELTEPRDRIATEIGNESIDTSKLFFHDSRRLLVQVFNTATAYASKVSLVTEWDNLILGTAVSILHLCK